MNPRAMFFEYITAIDTDSQERIFLADQRAHKMYVYNKAGEFVTIRTGKVPGRQSFVRSFVL
jgi:hypothetical protein